MSTTNLDYWRLETHEGRQVWKYLESEADRLKWPQSDLDRYWLGILDKDAQLVDMKDKPPSSYESAKRGLEFLSRLQSKDGWIRLIRTFCR